MLIKARHMLYWLAVAVGLPFILFAIAGTWLDEHLQPLYGRFRTWTHADRYARRRRS